MIVTGSVSGGKTAEAIITGNEVERTGISSRSRGIVVVIELPLPCQYNLQDMAL